MVQIKNILFPSDFSSHSLAALDYALDMVETYDAKLHLLHIVDDAYQYWMPGTDTGMPVVLSENELMDSAKQQMDSFIEKNLSTIGPNLKTDIIPGKPFLEIIRYAMRESIDLITIATHGHGAIASMFMGSVTEKVVRKASCPVLTVRHSDYKFEMP